MIKNISNRVYGSGIYYNSFAGDITGNWKGTVMDQFEGGCTFYRYAYFPGNG
jgi:hypothetical protein